MQARLRCGDGAAKMENTAQVYKARTIAAKFESFTGVGLPVTSSLISVVEINSGRSGSSSSSSSTSQSYASVAWRRFQKSTKNEPQMDMKMPKATAASVSKKRETFRESLSEKLNACKPDNLVRQANSIEDPRSTSVAQWAHGDGGAAHVLGVLQKTYAYTLAINPLHEEPAVQHWCRRRKERR